MIDAVTALLSFVVLFLLVLLGGIIGYWIGRVANTEDE